ncbi:putative g protein-coupled receptor/secretin-like protein [Diplodia seriata]|uniref:Putative g protein-coupled receptor/secretin-like protein n=1 Tax=Diplodia seriata TaxID=420778 RepID=A0A0G2DZE7_9PEZI|nr:putative g protein-coupled receptor/secretin-like protein [Diplodia seriata]
MDPAKRDPDFKGMTDGAAWVHVLGFILCGFLLISMAILPVSATRRTFLNIILLVGIMLLELGFIIPLARQPEQCHNAITPNDMNTSTTCAFSGAFAAFGGMTLVTWILIRAFFMHLQIVWDITPTKYHFLGANIAAWTVTIGLVSAVLAHAGVSFRFGGYCHVNHTGSIPTYWAWLLAFGGLAFVLQLLTFAYCIKVYLQAALLRAPTHALSNSAASSDGTGTGTGTGTTTDPAAARKNSAAAFSAQSRTRARAARAAARRVRQVLQLQWRSLAIVALAIFTTAFVCVVFIVLDNKQEKLALTNTEASVPWITCMILTRDNERCLGETGPIVISQRITVATLFDGFG